MWGGTAAKQKRNFFLEKTSIINTKTPSPKPKEQKPLKPTLVCAPFRRLDAFLGSGLHNAPSRRACAGLQRTDGPRIHVEQEGNSVVPEATASGPGHRKQRVNNTEARVAIEIVLGIKMIMFQI